MIYMKEKEKKYEDGAIYEGEFHEGNMHGKGIMIFTDGIKLEGNWFEGKMDGDIVKTYPDGKIEKSFYQNGINLG